MAAWDEYINENNGQMLLWVKLWLPLKGHGDPISRTSEWTSFGDRVFTEVIKVKGGHLLLLFSCSVMSDSAIPWTEACQPFLSFTISESLSIELVMPSNHLIFCHPLLLLPSFFPRIRVFSSELALHIRWPKYWSFSFSIGPINKYSGLIFFFFFYFYL